MILIKIKNKGNKGSWFNKYVDNLFLAELHKEVFVIKYLSNVYKDKLTNPLREFNGLTISRDNIDIMEKPKSMGVKGIINVNN